MNLSSEEVGMFLQEVDENIESLSQGFVMLEQSPEDMQCINSVFRFAHTLKGSAGAVGYNRMMELTHAIENVFDLVRSSKLSVTPEIMDVLFESLDSLKSLREVIDGTKLTKMIDVEDIVEKLKNCVDSGNVSLAKPVTKLVEMNDVLLGDVCVTIKVAQEALMPGVRIFQCYQLLVEAGTIKSSVPTFESIHAGDVNHTLTIVMTSDLTHDDLKSMLSAVMDIEDVNVEVIEISQKREIESIKERKIAEVESIDVGKAHSQPSQTVRVDIEKLDNLMNLVGELVVDRARITQLGLEIEELNTADKFVTQLWEIALHIGKITADLQSEIMRVRMLPIETVFSKYPRIVRDLSRKLNKQVKFKMTGLQTELDRIIIEKLGEPILHLIRNALDHGIEMPEERIKKGKNREGLLLLSASQKENKIVISVQDDGAGINLDRVLSKAVEKHLVTPEKAKTMTESEVIQLLFAPGFSTAEAVTDVSGRGVGMDVVQETLNGMNGHIEIDSLPGKGTLFTIKLPLTLAIIHALLISVCDKIFAVPISSVIETLRIRPRNVKKVNERDTIMLRDKVVPLLETKKVFKIDNGKPSTHQDKLYIVVVQTGNQLVGLIADQLIGEQEIVVKTLTDFVNTTKGISGATILGTGKVGLILDIPSLMESLIAEGGIN